MDLSVNRFSNTSFTGFAPSKIMNENGTVAVKSAAGKIYEILADKPYYMGNTNKKIIQYPVRVNGQETTYNIKYKTSQHSCKGVGLEILNAKPQEYQQISAREIAKDLDKKAEIADKKAQGINVFWA